jgi:hypothetical protein
MTRAKRPDPLIEMPDRLVVSKVGLGYVGSLMPAGVVMSIDRLIQQRGELLGELTVERAPEGHVFIGRFNLSSLDVRRRTAEWLGQRTNNVDWRDTLENFCLHVLKSERAGRPFELLGTDKPAEEVKFMLWPMLPAKSPTILFGEGGTGKSTLAGAVAVSVAAGMTAVPGWKIDQAGPVLIIDWEADSEAWSRHVAQVCRGLAIDIPGTLHYRAGAGPLTDQLDDVAQHIAQHGIVLLVIDSVGLAMPSRAEGADANEAVLRLFSALRYLDVTSLLIDHVAGADMGREGPVAKPYGSVYKWNLARNVFELRQEPAGDEDVMRLALFHRKANRTAKLDPIGLGIHHGPGKLLFTREDLDELTANAAIPLHSRIHSLLLAGGKTPSQIAEAVGASSTTVRTTLHRMKSMGMAAELQGKAGREKVWAAIYRGDVPDPTATRTETVTPEPPSAKEDAWG